jgi:dGTP triphosphohydrolase
VADEDAEATEHSESEGETHEESPVAEVAEAAEDVAEEAEDLAESFRALAERVTTLEAHTHESAVGQQHEEAAEEHDDDVTLIEPSPEPEQQHEARGRRWAFGRR